VVPDPAREADQALLTRRLTEAGLAASVRLVAHENRLVLAHVRGSTLRLHRGFAYAPDRVLRAVVAFAQSRHAATRTVARRELVSFPVHDYVPARRGQAPHHRPRADDLATLRRLRSLHACLNERHFGGSLTVPTFRVSRRMRRRLGEVRVGDRGCVIGISRRHIERDGWDQVEGTLLHEMVHQWQVESGRPLDHGRGFRGKAREIGIEASARRVVGTDTRRAASRRTDAV
jgi:hypothetical protein